uniref:Cytosolic fatty-acid binding proteins domain-containing protein n=1 Tax=Ciona savignyi TaxID=51511 RepID=H2YKV8_CIOSA
MDAFVGTYVVAKRDNFDGFMKGVGVPEEYIEIARKVFPTTKIEKSGSGFTVTRIRPQKTTSNAFVLGEETEVETIKGDKVKVTINMDGPKMVTKGENYCVTTEMDGDQLKETITLKGHTLTRWSKRA